MPDPVQPRPTLLSPRAIKVLGIAFAIGLFLFLLLWIDQRNDTDFYRASGSAPPSEVAALPAPLPSDVAGEDGGDNASGLRLPPAGERTAQVPEADRPRIIEPPIPAPVPVPSPPPPREPGSPPWTGDSSVPVPLSRPAPRYPREALSRNIGGTVRVQVVVSPDGSVERMEMAQSSGDRYLDRAAMEAVRRWRFIPAMRNGQPVTGTVVVPLEFNPGR